MLNLSESSLEWALRHALSQGDTNIFPSAFEFQAIEYDWTAVRDYLAAQDMLRWVTRPLRRALSPKRRLGFRVATQLDPLDFLILTALVYEIGEEIESHRLPAANQSEQYIASCRFRPSSEGVLFDGHHGYRSFLHRSMQLATSSHFSHVVLTDIADFYPRLYLHRVEGALSNATQKNNHVLALSRMLGQWNQSQSYGIPVGSEASKLIAELSIDDVDKILRSERVTFVRFMDDYRLFATSAGDAYRKLTSLAEALFKNHGLTLQQEKTYVVTIEEYALANAGTEWSMELDSLSYKFEAFLASIGIDDPYGRVDYDSLQPAEQILIDSLNLNDLLAEQMNKAEIDQSMVRFLLRRLGQLDDDRCVEMIIEHVDKLFTVFPDVIEYLGTLSHLDDGERHHIGNRVLGLVNRSSVSDSEFHRAWLFSLFSNGTEWGNSEKLALLYSQLPDSFSKRKLTLAMAQSGQDYWFRARKDEIFEFGGWARRAFLAGASCLPNDERRHWYRFLEPRLDILEKSVMKWAQANPFK